LKFVLVGLVCLTLAACNPGKPKVVAGKRYPFTGKIVSIDMKEHTATVDANAIPNYMDAMRMDYPIASDADMAALKVGENISATVNINEDGSYNLSDIHARTPVESGK
jgi:Cu/Ag efflux protein CusF